MSPDELNSDEVMSLLASLETSGGSDRRRHPRTPAPHHVTAVIRRPGSAPIHTAVRDLSCSGLGIYSSVPMTLDDQIEVQVNPHGRPLQALCRIAGCRLTPDGRYVIGLEFLEITRITSPKSPATATHETDPASHADAVAARLGAALAS